MGSVLKRLVDNKLLDEIPLEGGLPVRQESDRRPIALIITNAGLDALGGDAKTKDKASPKSRPAKSKTTKPTVKGDNRPSAPRAGSKLAKLLKLLGNKRGVTIAQLIAATGWQAHTVRAAITGLRKRGYEIDRRKSPKGVTVYHRVGV